MNSSATRAVSEPSADDEFLPPAAARRGTAHINTPRLGRRQRPPGGARPHRNRCPGPPVSKRVHG